MARKPTAEKPQVIRIQQVKRTRRFIFIDYLKGDAEFTLRDNENPLPAFNSAMDAMLPVALKIGEFPEGYGLNCKVTTAHIGSLRDVDTVAVTMQKGVGHSGKVFKFTTPPALLAEPQTEGAVYPPLPDDMRDSVEELIEAAKDYVLGKRAQGTLPLEGDDEDEDDDFGGAEAEGEKLPGFAPPSPQNEGQPAKKKRGAKAK